MLTATYSIIALKVEQNRARWTLSSLRQTILNCLRNLRQTRSVDADTLLTRLSQFEQHCRQRKMELFVIPALRRFTREADALLDEIEALGKASLALLRGLRDKLHLAIATGVTAADDIAASLEQCWAHVDRWLAREEELVPIAERVIPGDAWFGIAASFLSQDAHARRPAGTATEDDE